MSKDNTTINLNIGEEMSSLLEQAKAEIVAEDKATAVAMIKERLREIAETRKLLDEMEEGLTVLLNKEISNAI